MEAAELKRDSFWSASASDPVVFANPRRGVDIDHVVTLAREVPEVADQVIIETSGSGAEAKFVCLSRQALRLSARAVNEHLEVNSADRWLCALPTFHVGGLGIYARAFESGSEVDEYTDKWEPSAFQQRIAELGATLTSLVPTQVADLVAGRIASPPCLRALVVGGGRLPAELAQAARKLGWPVLTSYGMTEAASQIATQSLDCLDGDSDSDGAGLPILSHWEVRCGAGGCLEIRGDSLFSGYLALSANPETGSHFQPATDAATDRWFATRDLGEVEGYCLKFQGRADRVVKVLGELVDVDRVEAAFAGLLEPGERSMVTVVAVDDLRCGSRLVPCVETCLDAERLSALRSRYNRQALPFERLDEAIFVESIPRSALGKVRRQALLRLARLR